MSLSLAVHRLYAIARVRHFVERGDGVAAAARDCCRYCRLYRHERARQAQAHSDYDLVHGCRMSVIHGAIAITGARRAAVDSKQSYGPARVDVCDDLRTVVRHGANAGDRKSVV